MFIALSILTLCALAAPVSCGAAPAWDAPPAQQNEGQFWRWHWYQRGLTNANPAYEGRFRVNAPEISLHPTFGRRVEPRENGMMLIKAEEDLFLLTAAEFYCEAWGGHPGTANKRITVNGRSTYFLPRVGTEDGHCTYFYPSVPLKITDLVNGYDAVQFALDQGTTFWGHMLVDNAAIRVALTNGHPDLAKLGLGEISPPACRSNRWPTRKASSCISIVRTPRSARSPAWISRAGITATTRTATCSGATGTATRSRAGRRRGWDRLAPGPGSRARGTRRMLPAQKDVAVRALVRFKADTNLVLPDPGRDRPGDPGTPGARVVLFSPHDLPDHFWSRAGQLKTCQPRSGRGPGAYRAGRVARGDLDGRRRHREGVFQTQRRPLPGGGGRSARDSFTAGFRWTRGTCGAA